MVGLTGCETSVCATGMHKTKRRYALPVCMLGSTAAEERELLLTPSPRYTVIAALLPSTSAAVALRAVCVMIGWGGEILDVTTAVASSHMHARRSDKSNTPYAKQTRSMPSLPPAVASLSALRRHTMTKPKAWVGGLKLSSEAHTRERVCRCSNH